MKLNPYDSNVGDLRKAILAILGIAAAILLVWVLGVWANAEYVGKPITPLTPRGEPLNVCLIKSEKMELWRYKDKIYDTTVVCYYIRNPKIVGNKITTGLSCVVLED